MNKKKIFNIVIGICILLLIICFANLYLKANFEYQGEAYYKGRGYLLKEDFWNTIFFLIMQQFMISASVFYLFFTILNKLTRKWFFRIFIILWCIIIGTILIYLSFKTYDLIFSDFSNKERLIEIMLIWVLRVLGFFLGYYLVDKNFKIIISNSKKKRILLCIKKSK